MLYYMLLFVILQRYNCYSYNVVIYVILLHISNIFVQISLVPLLLRSCDFGLNEKFFLPYGNLKVLTLNFKKYYNN